MSEVWSALIFERLMARFPQQRGLVSALAVGLAMSGSRVAAFRCVAGVSTCGYVCLMERWAASSAAALVCVANERCQRSGQVERCPALLSGTPVFLLRVRVYDGLLSVNCFQLNVNMCKKNVPSALNG